VTTFGSLVDDVLLLMQGYGLNADGAAFLTGNGVTDTGLSFTVDSTDNLGAGLAEIGDELVWIKSVDDATATVTVAPDGRGYRGTVAAAYGADTRITMNPLVPRSLVKRKINETIVGVYPTLWGTASTALTYDPVVMSYEVPADVEDILQVTYREIGPSEMWPPVRRWRLDKHPDTVEFATGKSLSLMDSLWGVTDIRVVYQKQPSELSADADLLTASGLAVSARSVITTGAAWRLVSFIDATRLRVHTAVSDYADQATPMGAGTQVASSLRRQYERELADEQQRQAVRTVPVIHYVD